jgi:ribosomal protein S18 acetylase RimI-like enzyme
MEILPFEAHHIQPAAALFCSTYSGMRGMVPSLPARMADPALVSKSLRWLVAQRPAFVAMQNGQLAGYLGWLLVDGFRNTPRRAAYVPEWGWAAAQGANLPAVTRALYRAAASQWADAGVNVHAVTLLACDQPARETWFWAGFGLTVVDAVRPLDEPLALRPPVPGVSLRLANADDTALLAQIEAEHGQHYTQAPTLMVPSAPDGPAEFAAFLATPPNTAWLAFKDGIMAGYLRVQSVIDGGAAVLNSEQSIGITGAYVRPEYRGLGLAPALVEAARQHYAAQRDASGRPAFTCFAVDFESINPEAAAFWPRYFTPVTFSLIRVPERE